MAQPPPPPNQPEPDALRRWKAWHLILAAGIALLLGIGLGSMGSGATDGENTASPDVDELEQEVERLQHEVDDRDRALAEAAEQIEEEAGEDTNDDQDSDGTAEDANGGDEDANDPLAIGETGMIGDYEVTVTDFTADDTDAVLAANQFNEDPGNGQYGTVTFDATYTGDSDGMPGFDLSAALVIDGVQHGDTDCDAVVEDDALNAATLENGGTAEGLAFCFDHPGLNDTAEMFFDETMSFDDARVYWEVD